MVSPLSRGKRMDVVASIFAGAEIGTRSCVLCFLSTDMFNQVIGQSGSALSGWAFDRKPDHHARQAKRIYTLQSTISENFFLQIAREVGCPYGDTETESMVNCLKREKTTVEIVDAHKRYIVKSRIWFRFRFKNDGYFLRTMSVITVAWVSVGLLPVPRPGDRPSS